jgi:hypothetical protein
MNHRPLRFRVWDPITSRWTGFESFIGQGYVDLGSNDPFILTQFTGLIDSKGKDIYEGDICIGIRYGERFSQCPFKVEWCELSAGDDADLTSYGFHFNPYFNEYEIVGNVFENPDLIK